MKQVLTLSDILMREVRSVAVVGASPKEGKVGNALIKGLINYGFKGRIYPVNPKYEVICGLKSWPSMNDLPEVPDVVLIAIPAVNVPDIAEVAAKKGSKLLVVISSGFGESGRYDLESKLRNIAKKYGIRIIGPNSAGVIVTRCNLYASIEVAPKPGNVAVITQSGAVGGAVMYKLSSISSGVSFFISLGNTVDVDFSDCLDYAYFDGSTEAVIAYIEWLRNGRSFINAARRLSSVKPLVVIKGGWGRVSSEAVKSHTGGLATDYQVFKGAMKQCGAYLTVDLDEAAEVAEALRRIGKVRSNNALIVTNSGGLGILAASHIEAAGIELPPITEDLRYKVSSTVKRDVSSKNPIDFGGDVRIDQLIDALISMNLHKSRYGIVLLVYVPTSMESCSEVCKAVKRLSNPEIPVIFYFEGAEKERVLSCVSKYVPVASSLRNLASIVRALIHYSKKSTKLRQEIKYG